MSDTSVQTNGCLFCEIAQGRVRPHILFEDEHVLAFLDVGPIRRGHAQIIPRTHIRHFDDLPSELAWRILSVAQRVAKAQKNLYNVERVAFLFTGGDFAHAHAHVVPMVEKTDITSRRYIAEEILTFRALPAPSSAELEAVSQELRASMQTG